MIDFDCNVTVMCTFCGVRESIEGDSVDSPDNLMEIMSSDGWTLGFWIPDYVFPGEQINREPDACPGCTELSEALDCRVMVNGRKVMP